MKLPKLHPWEARIIMKSAPGVIGERSKRQLPWVVANTTGALPLTAIAMFSPQFSELRSTFKDLCKVLNAERLYNLMEEVATIAKPIIPKSFVPKYLGKLGTKEEPGKVRVFAMVDW